MPFAIYFYRFTLRGARSANARERALNVVISVINRLRLRFVQEFGLRSWIVVI